MKKGLLVLTLLLALSMTVMFMPGCGGDDEGAKGGDDSDMPEAVKAIKDYTLNLAKDFAEQLDGDYGDQVAALIKSGEGMDFAGYEDLQQTLADLATTTDDPEGTYVSVIVPDIPGEEAPYVFLIDGYLEDPIDYGYSEPWEPYYDEAWNGRIAGSNYAYWSDDDELLWIACAPIHDSNGDVVAVLLVEFYADGLEEYTDWIWPENDNDWKKPEVIYLD